MIELQIIAAILLIGRLYALWLYNRILKKQIALLRKPIEPEAWDFRQSLHYMTLALVVTSIPAIVLDIAVLWGVERTAPYLVVYAASNMIGAVIAAIMLHKMYQLSDHIDEVTALETKHVKSKSK